LNKKFYIVGVTYKIEGLFAIVNSVINHCINAQKNNYIPIVDMQHYQNQYFKDNKVFKDNVWEYFFEQPSNYNLNNIPNDSSIIIGKNSFYINLDDAITNKEIPESNLTTIEKQIIEKKEEHKKYIKFNAETQQYLDENFSKIIGSGNDVLGVLCRGTDYLKKKPIGEQIQPNPNTTLAKTKEVLKKYPEIKRIYLATEDNDIYQMFKKEFGNILIENTQYKYSYRGIENDFLSNIKVDRQNHNYTLAKEYILSIHFLSKCKYFIGGRTTGTKWAWILSDNNWKYFYIWNLGTYGKSITEQIFSISTEDSGLKKYKVYRFLGIKLKCKIK